jgi:hypothetical protein
MSGREVIATFDCTLLGSLHAIWAADRDLRAAIAPATKVITGRIPNIQAIYDKLPYCSITTGSGSSRYRTDKTSGSALPVVFDVWVGDKDLALGEEIELVIRAAYERRSWRFRGGEVIDVLDGGDAQRFESPDPEYHYWKVSKVMKLCTEYRMNRRRPWLRHIHRPA